MTSRDREDVGDNAAEGNDGMDIESGSANGGKAGGIAGSEDGGLSAIGSEDPGLGVAPAARGVGDWNPTDNSGGGGELY